MGDTKTQSLIRPGRPVPMEPTTRKRAYSLGCSSLASEMSLWPHHPTAWLGATFPAISGMLTAFSETPITVPTIAVHIPLRNLEGSRTFFFAEVSQQVTCKIALVSLCR